jgi:uncharacterized secreted protein with C-terminal beta-propeller domain/ribosomal protein S19
MGPAEASVFGGNKVRLVIEGAPLMVNPGAVLYSGRTYVPVRVLEDFFGLVVGWDEETSSVLINSDMNVVNTTVPRGGYYGGSPVVNVFLYNQLVTRYVPSVVYDGSAYVPLRLVQELGHKVGWDAENKTAYVGDYDPEALPVVGTMKNLEALLGMQEDLYYPGLPIRNGMAETATDSAAPPSAAPSPGNKAEGSAQFSETNIQVAGVDEADIVKTDGKYIYQVRGNVITIYNAYPADKLAVLTSLTFSDEAFYPSEIYIDDTYLVVIGRGERRDPEKEFNPDEDIITKPLVQAEPVPGATAPDAPRIMPMPPWFRHNPTTKAIVFDISDKENIVQAREVEVEGDYLTSRKIGSRLFLLANRYMYWYYSDPIGLPQVKDSAVDGDFREIDLSKVSYFEGQPTSNFMLIASLDLTDNDSGALIEAYLGAGNNVYMSHENLYVAVPNYHGDGEKTTVYRFGLDGIDVTYRARGEVPGSILNQFSMDDHREHFRIATTIWGRDGLSNSVYVLNREMNVVGKVENIAPNERIFSARFMGDKGYLVTFELIDPLFVLDLSEPTNPRILGELKIPGFSTYLHPLDDNHLLGIGRDTDVEQRRDWDGRVVGEFVVEKGIKLAIFDVRDVNNPIERHVEIIGSRGTHSEVLYNHKALLFDRRTYTLAFPVSIYNEGKDMHWGTFEFQGAVFYNVSLESGFTRQGRVTHMLEQEKKNDGEYYWYGGDNEVKRVLYIGDHFYVVSNNIITAHTATNLKETARVEAK